MGRAITLILIVAFLASWPLSVSAQQETVETGQWSLVEAVSKGEKLLVELKDGMRLKGHLTGVTSSGLTILRRSKTTDLKREAVARVYRLVGRSRGKNALVGAGVGAATGVGVGLAIYLPARDDIVGWVVPAFGAIGTGIGAGVGAAFGSGEKRVLVYRAN